MALRSFNWLIKYDNYSDGINHIAKIIKTVGGKTGLFFAGHKGNRGAVRTSAIPIWAGKEFEPTKVRLISGDAALFLGLEVIEIFRLSVDLDTRRLQFGQGEWKAMVRNFENRWISPVPTARGYSKLGGYFAKMGNSAMRVFAIQDGCEGDFDVREVPKSIQDGGWGIRDVGSYWVISKKCYPVMRQPKE